jgi:hypothetical protein
LLAGLALGGTGCAAVLIGGAVAGAGAAGYAYYKGEISFDFPAAFQPTWAATLAALQDLGLPIEHHSLVEDHGDIQTRSAEGENISIYVEPANTTSAPNTRVHIRVGVFGNQKVSERIQAQISARLQNPASVPLAPPGTAIPALGSPVSPLPGSPVGPPPGVTAAPKETAAPPLAPVDAVVPAVATVPAPASATPAADWSTKPAGK